VFYVNDPLRKMWSVNLQGRVPHDSDTNLNSTLEISEIPFSRLINPTFVEENRVVDDIYR
jgi:hypothetical protein